jgi:hypothetical protein
VSGRDIFGGPVPPPAPPTVLNAAASALDALQTTKDTRDPSLQESLRISSLPIVGACSPEEVEAFNRENVLASVYDDGWRLKPLQVEALMSYDLYGGAFLPLRVGAGKSLIALMLAERAYAKGLGKIVLLVPPEVYGQMVDRDIPYARRHVPLSVPFMRLGQVPAARRRKLASSGHLGCYILPYSLMSVDDTSELLDWISPELLILDEGHNLKNFSAARTARMFGKHGYLQAFEARSGKPAEMVVMSGTITSRSLLDYWHLVKYCLKERCPLPLNSHLVRKWAGVLDSEASANAGGFGHGQDPNDGTMRTDTLMPIVRWAQKHYPTEDFSETVRGFRAAFRKRFETCPGIVTSGADDLGVSLVFSNRPTPVDDSDPTWQALEKMRLDVLEGVAPNGDIIPHPMNAYGWLVELAAGFYNDKYWPDAETFAKERHLSIDEAEDILERALEHHQLRQLYHSAMRKWLTKNAKPGLDTPFLVASDMASYGARNVGPDLHEVWCEMHKADFEGRPERRKRPVRVCDYKIRQTLDWVKSLKKGRGAILWHLNKEVGVWLHEAGREAGLDILHCPSGKEGSELICSIGDYERGGKGDRVVTASVKGHGTGKNLQAFEELFVVQWPRSPVQSEQMLGRQHRPGLRVDTLKVHTCNTADIEHTSFAAALNDACYIQDTTGGDQKLMIGAFETPPEVLSSSELRRRGVRDIEMLSGKQVLLLAEKFGLN